MSKPPIPLPTGRDLYGWAIKLTAYLRGVEAEANVPGPKIVQLEHKKTGAKATEDGILMWSPADGTVVVSKSGGWYKVTIVAGGTP